jgi:hypothetical protein
MKLLMLCSAALLLDPRPVLAGSSCGGGSGGGGGGGSSGGSSWASGGSSASSSDSSSSCDSGPSSGGCIDDTDVHGYRHCTTFGVWSKSVRFPRIFVEGGSRMRSFASSLGGTSGSLSHGGESFTYRVTMPTASSQRDVALTSNLRVGFGLGRGLYSGVEFEVGGLVSAAAANPEMTSTGTFGSPEVDQQGGMVLGFAGIAGYRATGRRGSLALEGAAGMRTVRYNFESSYHNCETDTTIVSNRSVVEARARAETWLSPWLTFGVTLGSNVLQRNDWMAGIYFGAHSRAYAGTR